MKHTAAAGAIPAAAAMLAQRPNDARVSGAGPARKTFIRPRACKAPHPLQPIVRPRRRLDAVQNFVQQQLELRLERLHLRNRGVRVSRSNSTMCVKVSNLAKPVLKVIEAFL